MTRAYSAFVLVSRLQSELNRLFQEALQIQDRAAQVGSWQPEIDIVEDADCVRILVEVPGIAAADLVVEVAGNLLRMSGSKRVEQPEEQGVRFHRVERERGRFTREVRLLWPINTHQGRARLADGLLTVEFPKIQDQRQRSRVLPIEEDRKE